MYGMAQWALWGVLVILVVALWRRVGRLRFFTERIDFQLRQWLDEFQREHRQTVRMIEALLWDRLYRDGRVSISPLMTVDEVMQRIPSAQTVFAHYNITGCDTCAVRGVETVLDVTQSYQLDLGAFMNEILQSAASPMGTSAPASVVIPVVRPKDASTQGTQMPEVRTPADPSHSDEDRS